MNVLVSGATGFIGRVLISQIIAKTDYNVSALSRRSGTTANKRINIIKCDLFSHTESQFALQSIDVAIYLVHSMSAPRTQLSQGKFEDFDYLLADNFARACRKHKVKKIIYVSGILPKDEKLSKHLKSRFEVEKVLRSWGTPVTTLRCGLIIGPGGSSFKIVENLVNRLPVMLLPNWLDSQTNVVDIRDVVEIIIKEISMENNGHASYDLGNPEQLPYKQIVLKTAKMMGKNFIYFNLPLIPIGLSKRWIALISGVSKQLVHPLVDSLRHKLTCDPERRVTQAHLAKFRGIEDSISYALSNPQEDVLDIKFNRGIENSDFTVRSVQRIHLPKNWDSDQVATSYETFLVKFFKAILKVELKNDTVEFQLFRPRFKLLIIRQVTEIEFLERKLFDIVGGLLVDTSSKANLEFRESFDKKYIFAAIHFYRPRLHWGIYNLTQAPLHAVVMNRFDKYLKKMG